jgi:antitoxin HigA-1
MLPKNRPPTIPGEVLLEEFLKPMGMTQLALAEKMKIPIQRISSIVNGKRAVSAETAVLLGRTFGTTSEFWMNLQIRCDLWAAERKLAG